MKINHKVITGALLFVTCGLLTLYTNCAGNFAAKDAASVSSASIDSSVPSSTAVVHVSVSAPKLIATGVCSPAIHLSSTDAGSVGAPLVFAPKFASHLYSDSACLNPLANDGSLTTNALPLDVYLRADELLQDNFYVKAGSQSSDLTFVTVYHPDFTNVDSSNLGAYYLNSDVNGVVKGFALSATNGITDITTDIFDPHIQTMTPAVNTNLPVLLASVGFGGRLGFNDSGVYASTKSYTGLFPTSISFAVKYQNGNYICYTSFNQVFCGVGLTATYKSVDLPVGDLTDLNNTVLNSVCAVISGRVYCWNPDGAVSELTDLGTDVKQIAISHLTTNDFSKPFVATNLYQSSTKLCVLRSSGAITCVVNGVKKDLSVANAVRIVAGYYGNGYLAVKKRVAGVETWSIVNTLADTSADFAPGTAFDDIAFLRTNTTSAVAQGCGRSGKSLVCFKGNGSPMTIMTSTIANVSY